MKRKLAEIISLVLSTLTLLGIFGFLAYDSFHHEPGELLEIKTRVLKKEIKKEGTYFILPIEVANEGDKTPSKITFTVTTDLQDKQIIRQFEIEYLMRRDKIKVYVLFEEDPTSATVIVHPTSYQF
jgi:uncharacterized protein (TIGR02588 family)